MPLGLQVFDADGNTIVDTSSRLGRILGVTTISTTSGNLTNAGLTGGTPFYIAIPLATGDVEHGPEISVSGTTLSWDFQGRPVTNHRLVYGVY